MAAALIAIQSWIKSRSQVDDRGASLVEYALLLVLIVFVCVVGIQFLGTNASTSFSSVATLASN
jgi:Flp pilus assembly pilin Flp